MTSLKAIVFDLDGTLIHSAPDLHAAANVALGAMGREALDLAAVTSFIGNGVETLVKRCLLATGHHDAQTQSQTHAHFMAYYAQNMTRLTVLYPGVSDALRQFRAAGMRLGVCTNKPQTPARDICATLGIGDAVDIIVGATQGVPKKPDPASLLHCTAALQVAPHEVLYVGDSAVDYQTAVTAGIPFRLFNGGYLNAPLPDLAAQDRFESWLDHGIA